MSRKHRRARRQATASRKGLRRVHAVCTVLVLLGIAGFCTSLASRPPLPVTGEPWGTVLGVSGALLLACVALACVLLKDESDRITAGVTALLVIGLTMGVCVPDLLYRINSAASATSPRADVQERFVLLAEHRPAKRLDYFVLHTVPLAQPADLAGATQRHLSRPQYEALKQAAPHPGQALRLRIVQGLLGWPYVQDIALAP